MNGHQIDHHPFLVPPGKPVRLKEYDPAYSGDFRDKDEAKAALLEDVSELAAAQELLWSSKQYAVIAIFQAMDAAGKDGTIKHVMTGVNPQGVSVHSFKAPTDQERLHHFLWRPMRAAPPRGEIAIFNRSYYEEVLVVRVHPQFLQSQWLPEKFRQGDLHELWQARYDDINTFERTLVRSNTIVLKFFLNVSRKEQKKRFFERLDNPEKNWKFASADVRERAHWHEYMKSYEEMLQATSTRDAPWYIVPADKKWFTRACVADIIATRIRELKLSFPKISSEERVALAAARQQLEAEED